MIFSQKLKDSVSLISAIVGILAVAISFIIWSVSKFYAHDINGQWKFIFSIESSSMKAYVGKSAGYKIFIHQDDNKVTGTGDKWWVNNIEIPYSQHDQFEFTGSHKKNILNATYILHGTLKTTEGGFNMTIINDTLMTGTFAGTAADTKGHVIATKEGM